VDNFSKDETVDVIKKYQLKKKFNKINIGFSKAINFVLKKTDYDYYLLLNPDTEILPNAIKILLTCSIQYKASIVGGKHFKMDRQSVHGTVVTIPNLAVMIFDYTNLRKLIPFDLVHKYHYYDGKLSSYLPKIVGSVSGGFMLIKGELFKKIGYLDENFFMYLEDVDFCARASKAGEKVIYCPEAQIKHFGGGSSSNKYRTNLEAWKYSRKYFAKKYFSGLKYTLINFANLLDEYLVNTFTK
jgi:GT2 family glycosyltransferase